jgi:hypothetical protein
MEGKRGMPEDAFAGQLRGIRLEGQSANPQATQSSSSLAGSGDQSETFICPE